MKNNYNPFQRGSLPVGVKSEQWQDEERGTHVDVEIWYPAKKKYLGMDLDAKTKDRFPPEWIAEGQASEDDMAYQDAVRDAEAESGRYPFVLLVHGWAGHRRESTFIGTHLASHGYIVLSPDIQYSTFSDVDTFFASQEPLGKFADLLAHTAQIAQRRKQDVAFLMKRADQELNITKGDVGITGASFGGWTSLMGPIINKRIKAVAAMCPAVYSDFANDGAGICTPKIDYSKYDADVQVLVLAADRDAILPLQLQLENLQKINTQRKLIVMERADHNHFVDDIDTGQAWLQDFLDRVARLYPETEVNWPLIAFRCCKADQLTKGELAKKAWRGLILALMDNTLKGISGAKDFLNGDIDQVMRSEGICTFTIS